MDDESQKLSADAITDAVRVLMDNMGGKPQTANHADWMLYRHCRNGNGANTALCFGADTYAYQEVADAAVSCATWLRSLGIAGGQSVILLLPDCPVLVAAYFGVVSVGATAIILNPQLPTEDVFYIAQLSQAVAIVCDRKSLEGAQPLRFLKRMIAVKCADLSWRPSSDVLESVPLRQGREYTVWGDAENDAYGLLTSGSTGRPKLIVHRHKDILYGYLAFARDVLGLDSSDRVVCMAKMSTGYGLGSSLLMPFLAGACSVLVSDPPGQAVLGAIETHRCTLLLAQPRLLAEAFHVPQLAHILRSLRLVVTGGEPLGESLASRWAEVCTADLLDAYGNTEVGFLYITNRPGATRPGSIGQPIAGVEIQIIDEAATTVMSGELGKLSVRGPSVISGYRGTSESTRRHFKDGWFQTSDIASCDAEGYFYLHGRSDHFIKLGCGDWVNPNELEMLLLRHAAVNECAVIGAPDEAGLTVLKAVVVTCTAVARSEALASELSQLVRGQWPGETFRHIATIEFVDALPKTAAGKLDRSKLSPQSMTEFSYKC
jgi:benzoate-CoA ligase